MAPRRTRRLTAKRCFVWSAGLSRASLEGGTLRQSLAPLIDDGSIPEVSETIREHGIPKLMVVYFPGVDIYAHGSPNPLPSQTEYLESNIDRDVGKVLDEYSKRGALSDTYVIFTADHGHTPVLNDRGHDLAIRDGNRYAGRPYPSNPCEERRFGPTAQKNCREGGR